MNAGVRMEQIKSGRNLIYPSEGRDLQYYKMSTVAWFKVAEMKADILLALANSAKIM